MRRRMQPRQLKTLIETGHYNLEPALVAQAMLRRPAVRALLTEHWAPMGPTGRTPSAPEAPRQAA
jgi:hypothetical protein